jgi:hypothetical protein
MAVAYEGLDSSKQAQLALQYANQMGLKFTSGKRSLSEEMSLAGGSKTSMHLSGQAFDFSGAASAMKSFSNWAKASGLFTEVLDEGNHIHVGWATGKHAAGKTYVGNHTYIDQKGGVVDTSTSETTSTEPTQNTAEKIFSSTVKVLLVLGFIILGIVFLSQSFPVTEDLPEKIVKGVKKTYGHHKRKNVERTNG